jgi:hypothetical protein
VPEKLTQAIDDKFLEVVFNGRADVITTGDADLLKLNPFRGIPILSPREFLSYGCGLSSDHAPLIAYIGSKTRNRKE